jgi:hypothetical protein
MTKVCTRGLRRFTRKPSGYLVEPQNQDWRLGGRRRDPGALRRCRRTRGGITGLAFGGRGMRRRRGRAMKMSLYHNLSARGSVVFCLARRGLIYISYRVSRQTIHPDCFSFPCSIGLDFSSVCKVSDLRVNGSFHGCVDSLLVARWIFVSFLSYFL